MTSNRTSPLKLILGAASVGDSSADPLVRFDTPKQVNAFLDAFAARGGHQIDTARGYSPHAPGSSEPRIGAVSAGDRFSIDTKVLSNVPGQHTKEKVLQEIDASLEALKVKQIHIEYAELGIQYKLRYVRSLRDDLSAQSPGFGGVAVTRALVLAFDEIMLRDLSMALKHVRGAAEIVQIAGGPEALGLSNFVYYVLCRCISGKRLLDWFMMPERVPCARSS